MDDTLGVTGLPAAARCVHNRPPSHQTAVLRIKTASEIETILALIEPVLHFLLPEGFLERSQV